MPLQGAQPNLWLIYTLIKDLLDCSALGCASQEAPLQRLRPLYHKLLQTMTSLICTQVRHWAITHLSTVPMAFPACVTNFIECVGEQVRLRTFAGSYCNQPKQPRQGRLCEDWKISNKKQPREQEDGCYVEQSKSYDVHGACVRVQFL